MLRRAASSSRLALVGIACVSAFGLGASSAVGAQPPSPPLTVTVVEAGLELPWALSFLPDGSMLYTQRDDLTVSLRPADGPSRVVLDRPAGMWAGGETGLMGIEVSADFDTSGEFYTCHGYRAGSTRDVRVVAWKLNAERTSAVFSRTLFAGLPSTTGRHGGCALQRGGGNALYIGTGDAATGTHPQALTSGGGKVLRVSVKTGNGYATNPFATSEYAMKRRVWTYGHRNVQGLTRDRTGRIWSVEQGSYRDDEVNALTSGGNHGWNPVPRRKGDSSYNESSNSPMTDYRIKGAQRAASWSSGTSTIALSGGSFIHGDAWGSLDGSMAVAALKNQSLRLLTFSSSTKLASESTPTELAGTYGRLRGVEQGPDGALYVTTSNGSNDKILRITPQAP